MVQQCSRSRAVLCLVCLACAFALAGCAAVGFVEKGLEMVGLKKPEPPAGADGELAKAALPRKVTLRIHAGQVLNTDPTGRALSLVTRIYRLRSTDEFSRATPAMFSAVHSGSERAAYDTDVISFKEVVLTPGQKHEVIETLAPEVTHLAVVALFRAPDTARWRFVFDAKAAAKSGITLGAHGCALSVAAGEPIEAQPEALRLAGVQCR